MEEKINDSGFIPDLLEAIFKGEKVYYKEVQLMMGIFQGIGISQSLLEKNNKYNYIIINFQSKDEKNKNYNGSYLVSMEQFRTSKKKFVNGYNDIQRFVSFNDMRKI